MSGIYECPKCRNYYTTSNECERFLVKECAKDSIAKSLVKCACGAVSGHGIEYDRDIDGEPAYYAFWFDAENADENSVLFDADMLIPTYEKDTGYSTLVNGKVINLIPASEVQNGQ